MVLMPGHEAGAGGGEGHGEGRAGHACWSEFHLSYNMLLNLAAARRRGARSRTRCHPAPASCSSRPQRSLPTLLLRAHRSSLQVTPRSSCNALNPACDAVASQA